MEALASGAVTAPPTSSSLPPQANISPMSTYGSASNPVKTSYAPTKSFAQGSGKSISGGSYMDGLASGASTAGSTPSSWTTGTTTNSVALVNKPAAQAAATLPAPASATGSYLDSMQATPATLPPAVSTSYSAFRKNLAQSRPPPASSTGSYLEKL
jgi:hypothetical protein